MFANIYADLETKGRHKLCSQSVIMISRKTYSFTMLAQLDKTKYLNEVERDSR